MFAMNTFCTLAGDNSYSIKYDSLGISTLYDYMALY